MAKVIYCLFTQCSIPQIGYCCLLEKCRSTIKWYTGPKELRVPSVYHTGHFGFVFTFFQEVLNLCSMYIHRSNVYIKKCIFLSNVHEDQKQRQLISITKANEL